MKKEEFIKYAEEFFDSFKIPTDNSHQNKQKQ